MPNPYFQFKQFTVYHDLCAMKVGTDGVLLGIWTNVSDCKRILDIGTGTGLIALMLAQRNHTARIDAIDINEEAILQAKDNIKNSPFADRINCTKSSLQEYIKLSDNKYDLIVSNPPFFTQSLKSPDKRRTLARHDDCLLAEELMRISAKLLNETGNISVIYPSENRGILENLAEENNLYITHVTNVYPTPTSTSKRVLMQFSKEESLLTEDDLVIETGRHIYSERFTKLAKEFYIKM